MSRKKVDLDVMFQPLSNAAQITGLSYFYIREGCDNGKIPYIMVGSDRRVNMPLFLEQLNKESLENMKKGTEKE